MLKFNLCNILFLNDFSKDCGLGNDIILAAMGMILNVVMKETIIFIELMCPKECRYFVW